MSIHEQARALVRDLAPGPFQKIAGWGHALPASEREAIVRVARGFLAGHEAATRTREVTTVAELDALPAHAVILDSDGAPWHKPYDNDHGWWRGGPAWSHGTTSGGIVDYGPFRVLHDPEETP